MDLPYFGDAIQTTLTCSACGYRHGDLLLTRRLEAVRITLRIDRPEQLSDRIARSSSATIRIPELGAAMEPGPRAEAFVSNVEGVLRRFLDVVQGQEAVADSKSSRTALARTRRRIESMIDGKERFTLVLEDPTGNSDIQDEAAARAPLSADEAAALKSSETMIDLSDLAWAQEDE
jgi:zinc finger protein